MFYFLLTFFLCSSTYNDGFLFSCTDLVFFFFFYYSSFCRLLQNKQILRPPNRTNWWFFTIYHYLPSPYFLTSLSSFISALMGGTLICLSPALLLGVWSGRTNQRALLSAEFQPAEIETHQLYRTVQ